MAMNPASIMKIMAAREKFNRNHPKVMSFVQNVFGKGIVEGTIIEMTITRPGEEPMTTNMKVLQSDLELLNELKELGR